MWKLCLLPLQKFLPRLLSAVYQYFPIERSKLRSKVAAKDSQDCDSQDSLTLLFAFCKLLSSKKRLLKFDQELSACWKKKLRFTQSATNALVVFYYQISVNFFESGSARSDRCGSGSCLQIYHFYIPAIRGAPRKFQRGGF